MTPIDALTKVEQRLKKKGWCQRAMVNRHGATCLLGAVNVVTQHEPSGRLFNTVVAALGKAIPYASGIVAFNDTRGRKLEDVLEVVKKAREFV